MGDAGADLRRGGDLGAGEAGIAGVIGKAAGASVGAVPEPGGRESRPGRDVSGGNAIASTAVLATGRRMGKSTCTAGGPP